MMKNIFSIIAMALLIVIAINTTAQTRKEKKSKYYQNNPSEQDFNVKGFFIENEKNEVDKKPKEDEYDVRIERNEQDEKYRNEKRIIEKVATTVADEIIDRNPRLRNIRDGVRGYYTSWGAFRPYNEQRENYDKYYHEGSQARPVVTEYHYETPAVAKAAPKKIIKKSVVEEIEIPMTDLENEYRTTVVKRRYTNLDVLCDDLDLAKVQRPVFKGICEECAHDVDLIIVNKNMTSLEKNYHLKQCYVLRDKRLRETLDDDQYRKFLRIKDADEYLILTKDPELKDGMHK